VPSTAPNQSDIVDRLRAAGCVAAEEEADELVAAAPDVSTLGDWVGRREAGEPLAWITGRVRFCERLLRVSSGVYVPRPQTEELARRAATLLPAGGRALDLCTGAGAIAAHLRAENPSATVICVEVDPIAAACARSNCVDVVIGDLDEPLRRAASFDVVTAVAPYVPTGDLAYLPADVQRYEPRLALDGGPQGIDLIRRVVDAAQRVLRPGGWLLVEVGGDQDRVLAPHIAASGFDTVSPWWDDEGDLRGLAARYAPGVPNQRSQITMTPDEVAEFLDQSRTVTMATIGPDGTPHLVAMWYGLIDGKMYFETKAKSQKAANLRRDPRITCSVEAGDSYDQLRGVSIEGTATIIDDTTSDEYWAAGISVFERYQGPYNEEMRPFVEVMMNKRVVVRVDPHRIRTWDHRKLGHDPMPVGGSTAQYL
jgi:HemK-like putative methylase/PPOX class probable F420-dependent enzyme